MGAWADIPADVFLRAAAAGIDGSRVFVFLLLHAQGGSVARDDADPCQLATRCFLAAGEVKRATDAVTACVTAGLVRRHRDGRIEVLLHADRWARRALSGAQRMRAHRQRLAFVVHDESDAAVTTPSRDRHASSRGRTLEKSAPCVSAVTDQPPDLTHRSGVASEGSGSGTRRIVENKGGGEKGGSGGKESPPVTPAPPAPSGPTFALTLTPSPLDRGAGGRESPTERARRLLLIRHRATCEQLWALQNQLRTWANPRAVGGLAASEDHLVRIAERLDERITANRGEVAPAIAECEHALRVCAREARDRRSLKWFNGVTNWRPLPFGVLLGGDAGPVSGRGIARAADNSEFEEGSQLERRDGHE